MTDLEVSSAEFDRIDELLTTPRQCGLAYHTCNPDTLRRCYGCETFDGILPGRAVIPLDQQPTEPRRYEMDNGETREALPDSLTIREADQWNPDELMRGVDWTPRSVVVRVIGWTDGNLTVERET